MVPAEFFILYHELRSWSAFAVRYIMCKTSTWSTFVARQSCKHVDSLALIISYNRNLSNCLFFLFCHRMPGSKALLTLASYLCTTEVLKIPFYEWHLSQAWELAEICECVGASEHEWITASFQAGFYPYYTLPRFPFSAISVTVHSLLSKTICCTSA